MEGGALTRAESSAGGRCRLVWATSSSDHRHDWAEAACVTVSGPNSGRQSRDAGGGSIPACPEVVLALDWIQRFWPDEGCSTHEFRPTVQRFCTAAAAGAYVDFRVAPGEFVGVIGPNGSGKSTLVRAISRVLPGVNDGDVAAIGDRDGRWWWCGWNVQRAGTCNQNTG